MIVLLLLFRQKYPSGQRKIHWFIITSNQTQTLEKNGVIANLVHHRNTTENHILLYVLNIMYECNNKIFQRKNLEYQNTNTKITIMQIFSKRKKIYILDRDVSFLPLEILIFCRQVREAAKKSSSTNGQAIKASPPPPLEFNGHRNVFFQS